MPPSPRRRFNLLDAALLIAAVAVSIAGLRSKHDADRRYWTQTAQRSMSPGATGTRFFLEGYVPHVLVPLTIAFAVMRFRQPRPGRRRLMTQPGSVVFAAAVLVAALGACAVLVRIAAAPLATSPWDAWQAFLGFCHWVTGPVALGGWLVLLVGKRWRVEPTWVDRAGRVLGYLWVTQPLGAFL